jgi:glycosyltransferase involved in cell wall biosynthesis
MKRLQVWMLKSGEPLPLKSGQRLMRSGQIIKSLLDRGHQVTWWTGGTEHHSKIRSVAGEWQINESLRLVVLPSVGYVRNVSLRRYVDYRQVASRFLARASELASPDIIVAALPCHRFARAGVQFAAKRGIPSIVDYRDLWPELFESICPAILRNTLLGSEYKVRDECFRTASAIVGISPGYVKRGVRIAGRPITPLDRHFYLGAFPPQPTAAELPEGLRAQGSKKLLVYAGSVGRSYETEVLAMAARKLWTQRQDYHLVLCGPGSREVASDVQGHPAISALGWISPMQLNTVLGHAWAGLLPFRAGAVQSVPNKAFDYFASSLPVISSLEGEMRELIETRNLGFHYTPGSTDATTEAFSRMLDAGQQRAEWATNARTFYALEGNSGQIYEDYCSHLELVERKFRSSNTRAVT